jgi:hypothetical protein
MGDGDREKLGETEVERPPINGVNRSEITIPHSIRLTCVACDGVKHFEPDRQTEGGVIYACADCGHEIELDLSP